MLIEQGEAVDTNMSKIARMKTRAGLVSAGEYAPVAKEFNEIFGGEHPTMSWHWFLPLPVRFPEWAKDNIMGYEWNLTFAAVPYEEPGDMDTHNIPSLSIDIENGSSRVIDKPLEQDSLSMRSDQDSAVKMRTTGSFT